MEKKCVLENCSSSSGSHHMFSFPFSDPEMLRQWLEKIPKILYSVISNPSFLCDKHFERKFISSRNGTSTLSSEAVPLIFHNLENANETVSEDFFTSSKCRFCLRKFQEDEKEIAINQHLKKQFFVIAQAELDKSTNLPQTICENCFDQTRDFVKFKEKLLASQQRLEDELNSKSLLPNELEYLGNENELPEESPLEQLVHKQDDIDMLVDSLDIKDEPDHIDNESVCEEHLEPDLNETIESSLVELDSVTIDVSTTVHGKNSKERLCPECGKTYAAHSLKRHFERVHLKLKKYHCDNCDYKAYSRSHFELHMRTHLKIKTFFCEQCGAAFGNGNTLRQHFYTHRNDRPFVCDNELCQLSFKSIYALRRHQKTHLENKLLFKCDECDAKFADKWHLKRHQNGHQIQSVPCPNCSKVFGTVDRMKAHQIYHRPPNYQCAMCSKEFYKMTDLKVHIKTHTGQKDFQCNHCSNSYFKNAHLIRHLKTHAISDV